ncbi:hypothetical protein O6H91_10G100800 [Diphasiastrum complanatum]|uniref:Uncharacterized protein n=6 Tax=Diphasiastrum complanatum TaxID=34168 RepID=A0ACC2CJW2_DIPCM|nr:hypothetical protein O6H91_10G100800 [Diphasiastrum complanatum]KAJ7542313.1 hypothetical protein O6H91_10G100800 [Diphasiastrum complanatum]KAJ7542322.1 hypothetical protein O6H91_10G100800 [Diphasiastrum complanatum]
MASTADIGSSSHQRPQDLFVGHSAATSSSDARQLPAVDGAVMMTSCGQVSQSLEGASVEQGFLSGLISSDDCDLSDFDPTLAGIRSFRELLNFGVPDDENRDHAFSETAGGPDAPGRAQQGQRSVIPVGFGFRGNQGGVVSAEMCANGVVGCPSKEQFEGARAKEATEDWRGWRYGLQGGNSEQKAEQRQQILRTQMHANCEGSKRADIGLPSGSSSLDQPSIVVQLNMKGEVSSCLEFENDIPNSIAMPRQEEQYSRKRKTGVPVWVKWRGKWQACIQCCINDCSAATMKAMPTYSKKKYIVAYFPATRMYSWIDTQHVCAISENPEPLAGGSHESARESVKDIDMPRRGMLRSVAATMCDISDRLPIKAVIETAQDAGVWKSFAKEAVQSKEYSDIGKLLIRLFGMIVRKYLKSSWVNNSFSRWKKDCENAESASSIEKLNKELINAILWEEVALLWDKPEQSTLGSEWKDWKEAVFVGGVEVGNGGKVTTFKTVSAPDLADSNLQNSPNGSLIRRRKEPPMQQAWPCNGVDSTKFELSRKRSKLEIRRRVPYPVSDTEPAMERHDQPLSEHSSTIAAKDSAVTSFQEGIPENSNLALPITPTSRRLSMNGRFCLAFVAHKNRQCTRFANEGSLYCCKHLNFATNEASEKSEKVKYLSGQLRGDNASYKSPALSFPRTSYECRDICRAMTKYGRRCAFKVIKGSIHCKRHSVQNDAICSGEDVMVLGDGEKPVTQAIEICPANVEPGALSFPTASIGPGSLTTSIERKLSNWRRCIGWCKRNGEQCSHRAKVGTLYCKKHLWLAKISVDASSQRFQLQETTSNADEDKLSRSKFMLDNYLKTALALNDRADRDETGVKSKKELADKVLAEASKDMVVARILLRLVVQQKLNLEAVFGLQNSKDLRNSEAIVRSGNSQEHEIAHLSIADELKTETKSGPHINCSDVRMLDQDLNRCNNQADKLKCSICIEEFMELVSLGCHWKTSHYKEAQCFLKGYICRVCGQELTSKPAIDRHWKAQHEGLLQTPAMPICMVCDGNFIDFDILWEHVVSIHSDHLSGAPTASSLPAIPSTSQDVNDAICSPAANVLTAVCKGDAQDILTGVSNSNLPVASIPSKVEGDILKFKCKFCGKRFRILPDLGRHHQAEHMTSNPPGCQTKKGKHYQRSFLNLHNTESSGTMLLAPSAGRWKKRSKVVKDGLNSLLRIKAAVQSLKQQNQTKNTNKEICESSVSPNDGHGFLGNGLLLWSGPRLTGSPSDDDILSVANSVCCIVRLCSLLESKYETLPHEFSEKAFELCRGAMLTLDWIKEGFVCPNGCKKHGNPLDLAAVFNATPADMAEGNFGSLQEKLSSDAFPVSNTHANSVKVICEDVSSGQESVPVPCVVDEDLIKSCNCASCKEGNASQMDASNPWETFSYITRRLLKPSLGLDTKSSQLGCSCKETKCSPESCDHVLLFDSDNTDACDIYGQSMHGRFPYTISGQIILQEGYLVYECNSSCHCQEECTNRVLQKGVQIKLEVFKTCHKGWAVRAAQHIPRGTFVCEYLGEVLNDAEANKRGERYDTIGCSYLYDIDVHLDTSGSRHGGAKPFVIDATKFGNVSRFINHSCAPNLINYQVLVESMDCQLAHIGLYASRDIAVGEELAYDYRYKLLPGKGFPCHCGAGSCRGRLY